MSQTPEMSMSLAAAGVPGDSAGQEGLFDSIVAQYAAPMARLARAHESDAALQQDLLQEIYLALWRSLPAFRNRCSLRTWIYRVAHNVAATHVLRAKRRRTSNSSISMTSKSPTRAPRSAPAWTRRAQWRASRS